MLLDLEIFSAQELLEIEFKNNKKGAIMLMSGIITKIGNLKPSRFGKNYYRRIEFKLDHGIGWAKTDIVQGFRNSKRWEQGIDLGVGTICKNLKLKKDNTIDADSKVIFKKGL